MVGNGIGAKNGILFKTASSLEETGVTSVILDKTGTITKGEPKVTDMIAFAGSSEKELLEMAYTLEVKSEHPIAKAVVEEAERQEIKAADAEGFEVLPGNGLSGRMGNEYIRGGNLKFIGKYADISTEIKDIAEKLSEEGKTPLFFAKGNMLTGIIAVADVIKEDSPQAVKELKDMGIRVVMLTGDNEKTAQTVGRQAGSR